MEAQILTALLASASIIQLGASPHLSPLPLIASRLFFPKGLLKRRSFVPVIFCYILSPICVSFVLAQTEHVVQLAQGPIGRGSVSPHGWRSRRTRVQQTLVDFSEHVPQSPNSFLTTCPSALLTRSEHEEALAGES